MNKKPILTPASTEEKNTTPPQTLGEYLHSKLNWGGGSKPSGSSPNVIAGGAGHPASSDVTQDDLRLLMELARERHGR